MCVCVCLCVCMCLGGYMYYHVYMNIVTRVYVLLCMHMPVD